MANDSTERARTTAHRRRSAFSGLDQRVLRRCRNLDLAPGTRLVVGFSGGTDSLCLAAILARTAEAAKIEPILAHVDHALRESSAADAERARLNAASIGLPIRIERVPRAVVEIHPGVGVEEAARRERYRILVDVARELGADLIATAHHQDDQAETVLLHLLRGAGLAGASAMRELSELTVPWWAGEPMNPTGARIWRPLLTESKRELEAHVAALGFTPIEDETNALMDVRRNAIRHRILPELERIFPTASSSLARFAEIAGGEDEFLAARTAESIDQMAAGSGALELSKFQSVPEAIQRRVVLQWLRDMTHETDIPFERVLAVLDLSRSDAEGSIVEVVSGFEATVIGGQLMAGERGDLLRFAWDRFSGPNIIADELLPVILPEGRWITVEQHRFGLNVHTKPTGVIVGDSIRLPATLGEDRIHVRRVRPGDRFAAGGRNVDDWLRRHRVPVMIRDRIVCVGLGDTVWWIPGLPLPARAHAAPGEPAMTLSWESDRSGGTGESA